MKYLAGVVLLLSLTAAAQDLPPISYVCPMPQDGDVLETSPGKCRKCGMVLKPVRLDVAYSCPRHPFVITGKTGICPVDGQPLARITASVYWTCAGNSNVHELVPGKCADGQPRVRAFERLAHGDHNPRHGGQFFMADDNWHHVEGTHPARDTFRVFFYDDYTRPIAPAGFSGTVAVLDRNDREVASVPLTKGRVARTLEARIPASQDLRVKLKLRFPNSTADRVFDFAFQDVTRESAAATTTRVAPVRPAPPASPALPASPAAPGSEPATVSFLAGAALPQTAEGLLDELSRANRELRAVIDRGEFGVAWVSAMRAKDAAIALQQRPASAGAAAAPELSEAVKQLVLSAWQIDAVGDLGDREKITKAYAAFDTAAATIVRAYTPR